MRGLSLTDRYFVGALIAANPRGRELSELIDQEEIYGGKLDKQVEFFDKLYGRLFAAVKHFRDAENLKPLEAVKAFQFELHEISTQFLDPRKSDYAALAPKLKDKTREMLDSFEERAVELQKSLESKNSKPGMISRFFNMITSQVSQFFSKIGRLFKSNETNAYPVKAPSHSASVFARPLTVQAASERTAGMQKPPHYSTQPSLPIPIPSARQSRSRTPTSRSESGTPISLPESRESKPKSAEATTIFNMFKMSSSKPKGPEPGREPR